MNNLLYSINNIHYSIFKKGSKTYFYSSLLFPKEIRQQIAHLYSFVRTADNFVDSIPQQKSQFNQFTKELSLALKQKQSNNIIIQDFLNLSRKKDIKFEWIEAFLLAMKTDMTKTKYKNFNELDLYIYGSAEVIGLMLAKILNLDPKSYPYAKKLGKSMQYINFIRDIAEDNELKRIYIPQSELKKYGLKDLEYETVKANKSGFIRLIRSQIETYYKWQKDAEVGFKYISPKYITAIKTASDLYKWTATQIYKDPFIIYTKKVKPPMHKIIVQAGQNVFKQYLWI